MPRRGKGARKPGIGYAVGYGPPPAWTRFWPGQSGNPKGRPKGTRNAASMARDALERKVDVRENGAQRKMTVREVSYRRLADKAVSGDVKALNYLLSLENEEHRLGSDLPDAHNSSEKGLEILQAFFDRRRAAKGDKR